MNIRVHAKTADYSGYDTLVVVAHQPDSDSLYSPSDDLTRIDSLLGGTLSKELAAEKFTASPGKSFLFYTHSKISPAKVIVLGLGKPAKMDSSSLQLSYASLSRRLTDCRSHHASVLIPASGEYRMDSARYYQSVCEGLRMGAYQFLRHKTVDTQKYHAVSSVDMSVVASEKSQAQKSVTVGSVIAGAVLFTRDLVNESPSVTTPSYLGKVAQDIAAGNPAISCKVYGKKEITQMKMGGVLAIARGSDEEPKFITLTYRGGGDKTVAIIGKGITFDTGGLSLKPSNSMETMKLDMAGGAAVLGVFQAISALSPKITVVGIIPATENMPGPNAIKPGDVVKTMSGKTIEILNTDAEGRVVLADALAYAASVVKPDYMIDLATLTGACVVALGEEVTGLFSNTNTLAGSLLTAAKQSGESLWEMPLVDAYRDQIKSAVADIKNIGAGRWGGAVTAALFLQEFVPETSVWAHLDIAGPAFAEKDMVVSPVGGTGHGVRTIVSFIQNLATGKSAGLTKAS